MISSFRLTPIHPAGGFGEHVSRLGGRCFLARGPGGPAEGDVLVTLPAESGGRCVIVPKGMGSAVVANGVAGGWVAAGSGSTFGPARWASVGSVAAWVRSVRLPVGPNGAVGARERPIAEDGGWIVIRPVGVAWAEARRADPSAGRGAVVVLDRWVRAVSPVARACGVAVGMSAAQASARCAAVRFIQPPPRGDSWERMTDVLEVELAGVTRSGAGFVARAGGARGAAALALAERIAHRLWQSVGVEARIAVAGSAAEARALVAVLEPNQVAVAPHGGAPVWSVHTRGGAWSRSARSASWRGPSLPDVEGIVALCRSIAPSASGPLRLTLDTGNRRHIIDVPAGPLAAAARVESAVRECALGVGPISAVRMRALVTRGERRVAPHGRVQLPLLPAAR